MTLRVKSTWILVGLATLGATLVGGHEAQAVPTHSQGIVVTSGTTQQVTDPAYEYNFGIALTPNETLDKGGYITIYDLPGLTSLSTAPPPTGWKSSVTYNPSEAGFDVTWTYNGPPSSITSGPGPGDDNLGTFSVGPTTQLGSPPTPTLNYVGSLNGITTSNGGTITVQSVPEPSSVILLMTGAGMLSLLGFRRRRRSVRQNQGQLEAA